MRFKYIIFSVVFIIVFLCVVLYTSVKESNVEHRYGEFSKIYNEYRSSKAYFVILNKKETGILLKYGDVLLINQNKCLTHLTDYSPNSVKIYEFLPDQTYGNFTIKDAERLKKTKTTRLIY